jgi:prepilin peptidase CpaA
MSLFLAYLPLVSASQICGIALNFVLFGGLAAAAWIDSRTCLIPNRLTYSFVALGVSLQIAIALVLGDSANGCIGIEESLKGTIVCFGMMLFLFVSNATGGGDVKLAAAIGAFLGANDGLMAIAWCHLTAGSFAIFCLLRKLPIKPGLMGAYLDLRMFLRSGLLPEFRFSMPSDVNQRLPMAAFFGLGVIITKLGIELW